MPLAAPRPGQVRSLPDELLDDPDFDEIGVGAPLQNASSSAAATIPPAAEEVPPVALESADPVSPAGLFRRFYAGIVDLGVVLFACLPFVSCVELAGGNLTDWRVLALLGVVGAVVGFLYLSLLLTMAGRTVGMAIAGLLLLDARTMDLPSFFQVVGRMVGFLLGIASLGIGIFWSLVDRERRTFADLISRTVVRRVSESVYASQEARAPWFYRPARR